jgi:hypothetical protein
VGNKKHVESFRDFFIGQWLYFVIGNGTRANSAACINRCNGTPRATPGKAALSNDLARRHPRGIPPPAPPPACPATRHAGTRRAAATSDRCRDAANRTALTRPPHPPRTGRTADTRKRTRPGSQITPPRDAPGG